MIIYLVIWVLLILISFRGIGKFGMQIFLLGLSIILGFRSSQIGVDTENYVNYYNETSDIFEGYMEKGWNVIVVSCKMLGLSAYGCNFIVALLTLYPFYYIAKKSGDNRINGYVLFLLYSLCFYFLMFNGMRQHLAISVLLMGYYFLSKKKTLSFVVCVLVACTIHISSLLALFMLFVNKMDMTVKKTIWVLLLSYFVGFFLGEAFFLSVSGKYAHDVEGGLRTGVVYVLVFGLLTNLFTIWLYKQYPDLRNNFWVKCNIVSVVVLNLLSNLVIGPRVVYIFSITSVVALALYLRYSSNKLVHLVVYLYSLALFVKFLIPEVLIYGFDGSLVPYSMNFQPFM